MMTSFTFVVTLSFLLLAATQVCSTAVHTRNTTINGTENCSQSQKQLVQEFNSVKDWATLKGGLQGALDHSSMEYKQLQNVSTYPMFIIGNYGYVQLASLLLCGGLLVDTPDRDGETMLHGAANAGNLDLVKLLLDHGANVNVRGRDRFTPLMWAAQAGHIDVVQWLVEQADANTALKNTYHETALILARDNDRMNVTNYLEARQHVLL